RLCRQQADLALARGLHGRVCLGLDHTDHRNREQLLQLRQRRRSGRVAGDEDELHVLALQVAADLQGKPPNLLQRPGPIRQARMISEVDEVLVRHRHETLVQDGEPSRARVKDADRPRVHRAIVQALVFRDTTVRPKSRLTLKDRWRHQGRGYMKRSVRLTVLACAAALALAVVALAAASYTPSMGIFQATYKAGG